jgi:hypothetical protein
MNFKMLKKLGKNMHMYIKNEFQIKGAYAPESKKASPKFSSKSSGGSKHT